MFNIHLTPDKSRSITGIPASDNQSIYNNNNVLKENLMKFSALVSIGSLIFSTSAFAAPSTCETYASTDDIPAIRIVEPATDTLTDVERGMIQTTILVGNSARPVTVEQAIAEFTDAAHGGSNGGNIVYSEIKVGNRTRTVVRVTFYPGENEYGLLFQETKKQSGIYVDLLGTIQDGDILCLNFQN